MSVRFTLLILVGSLICTGCGRDWVDASRSLAWSVGVDRNNNGVIERDALGFNYEPSDIEFLKGVRPPQGFTKIEMSSDVDVRAWRGNWEGFTCNLMVELTYAVGGHSYYLTADCNHLKGS